MTPEIQKECDKETHDACFDCGKYRSSHSEHYDSGYKQKVSTILCLKGDGYRVFNEEGERIN